jgi:hypothetical protein
MLANRFSGVNEQATVLESASSLFAPHHTRLPVAGMYVWSLPKVFHTCGKNCGKSTRSVSLHELGAS